MNYEKPDLDELELILEGSFLDNATGKPTDPTNPDLGVEEGEGGGGGDDDYWN